MGNSRSKALRLISNLRIKLEDDSDYARAYVDFLDEYEKLGHMKLVPSSQTDPESVYYLPHHGVIRENSTTTKLRVVFNGSSRTDSGVSLNDLLHTGTKLQTNIFNVLIWFRQFKYIFSSDIEKMYRQIKIHEEDWNFQRILWINNDNIVSYQLTTVTYGLACAPFLALRTFNQLIEDEGENFPLAIPPLTKGRYVDDIFGGADSIPQAQNIVEQLNSLCMAGGFPLQKWISNHSAILESIPLNQQTSSASVQFEDSAIIHILGLCWNPSSNTFQFSITSSTKSIVTKRTILSTIAKIFDPLGLLAPITISAKILIQELWTIKLGWDDPLPFSVLDKWTLFQEHLQDIPKLIFLRWLTIKQNQDIEIHGFCDASQLAMCAAIYVKTKGPEDKNHTHLICAKTKVAPIKKMTIPRLELTAAFLLTQLVSKVMNTLQLNRTPVFLWTDSAVVHTWINSHPSRWKEFVHNRVRHIQETLPQATWKFIPGVANPSDYGTRGFTASQLIQHTSWWTGSAWLSQEPSTWPQEPQPVHRKENLEERASQVLVANQELKRPWNLINKYSNLTRLLRITAWCMRAIALFRRSQNFTPNITTEELETAKVYWIKNVQQSSFQQELKSLSRGCSLSRSNLLLRLTPFLDTDGLLRIGDCWENARQ